MIHGVGIDLVENERIENIILKWGDKFLERVFCDQEVAYCSKHAQSSLHYAARFAAKECFLKALGIGLGMGVKLKDIEVTRNSAGQPSIAAHGEALNQLKKNKIKKINMSLTHTKKYAAAFLVMEKD